MISTLEAGINSERFQILKDDHDPQKYKKNLAKVVIYFQEFNFESIEELPGYDVSNNDNAISDCSSLCTGDVMVLDGTFVGGSLTRRDGMHPFPSQE